MRKKTPVSGKFTDVDGHIVCRNAFKDQMIVHGNEPVAKALCKIAQLQSFHKGEKIITQGDRTNDIVFILDGTVAVVRDNREIAHRKAGECIGEMAVIDLQKTRSASIVAREETTVGMVKGTAFMKLADNYPELWKRLAKQTADRLRQRLEGVRVRNKTPRVFIGSSSESKKVAKAVESALENVAAVVIWMRKGLFEPGKFTLESLEEEARKSDFAVMVFGPDDVIFSRGNHQSGPRDNVIFELGLFMGALDRKRAFVISPRGKSLDLKIPTDLLGTNLVTYPPPGRGQLGRVIGEACDAIRKVIKNQGPF